MNPTAFDGTRVLGDRTALHALVGLADRLRRAGYSNAPSRVDPVAGELALGYPVSCPALGQAELEAFVRSGAGDVAEDRFVPRFTLFALGEIITLVPKDDGNDPGRVYFGRDSLWLADFVSRLRTPGGAVADLGTGAGMVAAVVAPRFDVVVATDIVGRTVACAAVTFALNPRRDGTPSVTAVATDVAAGLAPGTFALVTGNPPWVPDLDHEVAGPSRVFAEGGATGFELPRRFIVEGAALLAPGGVMVMLALDATWADGARPLRSLARGLMRLGLEVSLAPTGLSDLWDTLERDMCERIPKLSSVSHVALVAYRPALDLAPGDAGAGQLRVVRVEDEAEQRPEQSVGDQLGVDGLARRPVAAAGCALDITPCVFGECARARSARGGEATEQLGHEVAQRAPGRGVRDDGLEDAGRHVPFRARRHHGEQQPIVGFTEGSQLAQGQEADEQLAGVAGNRPTRRLGVSERVGREQRIEIERAAELPDGRGDVVEELDRARVGEHTSQVFAPRLGPDPAGRGEPLEAHRRVRGSPRAGEGEPAVGVGTLRVPGIHQGPGHERQRGRRPEVQVRVDERWPGGDAPDVTRAQDLHLGAAEPAHLHFR